jgi:hypothetical protein
MVDRNDRRRVYLYFQFRQGWHCQFLEEDLRTSLPRTLTFSSSDKVIALIERGGGLTDLASRQALDQAIATGRGGVFLSLSAEQYAELRKPRGNHDRATDS